MRVEERLLLDGIALGSGDVSPGHVEGSAAVIANLANAGLTIGDGATMSAGKTADAILVEPLVKLGIGFADSLIENAAEGGQGVLASILTLMREEASGCRAKGLRRLRRNEEFLIYALGRTDGRVMPATGGRGLGRKTVYR
jgi:hypothetical protein